VTLSADGLTASIPLQARDGSLRAYALIDSADAAWATQWQWSLHSAGYAQRAERRGGRQTLLLLHRELLGLVPGDGIEVDHEDRNRLNNRRCNLRICTGATNRQNLPAHARGSSSGRGVYWDKRRCAWIASLTINGTKRHVGQFKDESDAIEAARDARRLLMPFATD